MAGQAQTYLTKTAAPIAEKLAGRGKLKLVLSAGVMALNDLTPKQREEYYDMAKDKEEVRIEVMMIYNEEVEEISNQPDWQNKMKILRQTKDKDPTLFPSEKRLMLANLDYLLDFPEQAKAFHEACKKLPPMKVLSKAHKTRKKQK